MKVSNKLAAILSAVILMISLSSSGAECYWYYPPSGPAEYVCPSPTYFQTLYFEPDWAEYSTGDQVYNNLQANEWYVVPSGIILNQAPYTYYCYGVVTSQQTVDYRSCTFIP